MVTVARGDEDDTGRKAGVALVSIRVLMTWVWHL